MSLARKLARLETIVSARADETPAVRFWTPERIERWRAWIVRLLETMPDRRAVAAYVELTTLPAERWGPVARRLHDMACRGADGRYAGTGWPYWSERAVALPGAICEALERHPDAGYAWDFSCEACGLELPHRTGVPQADAALFDACPLCGGREEHCGYTHRRYHEAWERQKCAAAKAEERAN